MKEMWIKEELAGITAYFVRRNQYDYEVRAYSDYTAETFQQFLNDRGGYSSISPNNVGGHFFTFRGAKRERNDLVTLPAGTYKFNPDIYPHGEGLEVIPTRSQENYIELQEQNDILVDIRQFLNSKKVYEELEFIYRRGYLLYGPPGNGKTALIRSLTKDAAFKDAIIIWLSYIPGTGMIQALNSSSNLKVLVFEEIVNQHGEVNFHTSQLLDFLDGEGSISNCITIATTNYPHLLHANLADRPSRFDVVSEIKEPTKDMQQKVLEKLLGRFILSDEFEFDKFSFAQLKEVVLLHKLHNISLKEAAAKMKAQSDRFKQGFEDKKAFGLHE